LLRPLPPGVRDRSRGPREERVAMLIKNEFEVAAPGEKGWGCFCDSQQVATCLPGTELTDDLGDDRYAGRVAIRMGPVRLSFGGTAQITEGDQAAHRIA